MDTAAWSAAGKRAMEENEGLWLALSYVGPGPADDEGVLLVDLIAVTREHRGKGRALDLDGKADLEHIEGGRHAAAHFGGKGTEGRGRMVDDEDASEMAVDIAYGLARQTYRLG